MQIDRWYFDLQNENEFGFYTVGIYSFLGVKTSFAEVTHNTSTDTQHYFLDSWGGKQRPNSIKTSHAKVNFDDHHLDLTIKKGKQSITGNWTLNPSFEPLTKGPIFENDNGKLFWDLIAPRSKVILHRNGNPRLTTSGSGYIHHFRLTIPLRKIPFKVLHWGRLYDETGEWIILFHYATADEEVIHIGTPTGWQKGDEVSVQNPEDQSMRQYLWNFENQSLKIDAIAPYREEMLLNDDQRSWFSEKSRKKWSKSGFETKYQAVTEYNGKVYKGTMDEIRWRQLG